MIDTLAIAARLREIAAYLTLEKEPYKARAYERGAGVVESVKDLAGLIEDNRLTELPGVGVSLARTIEELSRGGSPAVLERLRAKWPRALVELQGIPGLTTARARALHEQLGIATVEQLEAACVAGAVRQLNGFGEKTEQKLLEAIRARAATTTGGTLLVHAREQARQLVAHLRDCPAVVAVEVAGAVRRWCETIDAVELAVASRDAAAVRAHLDRFPSLGAPVVLHVAAPERFGDLLVEATGPAEHWQALSRATAPDSADEASFYAARGLPWIPPEVRGAELVAPAGRLVERGDVRGAVHCHTTYSDGTASIAEMARAAGELGLDYITITNHSQSAGYAGGLTVDRLRAQWDEIDEVQATTGIRILKGTESDILADGALDYPDDVLERLDVVIASVHQRHKLDARQATARLVRALELPVFKIWGHPLGRMLLRRDPIACDLDAVLDAAARSACAIELNGDPHRMDLAPDLARAARTRGLRFVLSCDAHSTRNLEYLEYAVHMARRAGLQPSDVLNTLPAADFLDAVRPCQGFAGGLSV